MFGDGHEDLLSLQITKVYRIQYKKTMSNQARPEGGETDGREDTKNMHEIILASTNCMDTLCTGQDNGWFRSDYIRRSEISCNGYEIAWYSLSTKRGFTNFP